MKQRRSLQIVIGIFIVAILGTTTILIPYLIKQKQLAEQPIVPTAPGESQAWMTPGGWGFRIGGADIGMDEKLIVYPLLINESDQDVTASITVSIVGKSFTKTLESIVIPAHDKIWKEISFKQTNIPASPFPDPPYNPVARIDMCVGNDCKVGGITVQDRRDGSGAQITTKSEFSLCHGSVTFSFDPNYIIEYYNNDLDKFEEITNGWSPIGGTVDFDIPGSMEDTVIRVKASWPDQLPLEETHYLPANLLACITPTPTITPTATPTLTPTPDASPTPTLTITPTPTATPTPPPPSCRLTVEPRDKPTGTPTSTPTPTDTPTMTPTPTNTPTPTETPTPTSPPTVTPTPGNYGCGYVPCTDNNSCLGDLSCVEAVNGIKYCSELDKIDACIANPSDASCCHQSDTTPTPTPTPTPGINSSPTPTPYYYSSQTPTPVVTNTPTPTPTKVLLAKEPELLGAGTSLPTVVLSGTGLILIIGAVILFF